MTELNPSLILQAGNFDAPDLAGLLERRSQIQLRNLGFQKAQRDEQAAQAQLARRQTIGSMAAGGDLEGADKAAIGAGDWDLHGHISGLQDDHKKQLADKAAAGAAVAFQAKQLPYEQRKAAIASQAQALAAHGWKPEEIAAFDPSDSNIDMLVGSATSIADAVKRSDDLAKQAYTEKKDTLDRGQRERGDYLQAGLIPPGSDVTSISGTPTTGAVSGSSRGNSIPVPNGRAVAERLFPGVRVTDNKRDPNSALGKANPGSWHVKSGGAVDVAPIKGMDFDQYVQTYKDAGYQIIEAIDEVKNPSKHATGPHWHVVVGQKNAPNAAGGLRPIPGGKLDPNREESRPKPPSGYEWDGSGGLKPIKGGPADKRAVGLPKVPGTTIKQYVDNNASMRKIAEAKAAVEKYKDAVGGWNSVTPDFVAQRIDPNGVKARSLVADIGSLIIHDRSGAAVTASETPRLKPFIPTVSDTPETIGTKLDNFMTALQEIQSDYEDAYSNEDGDSLLARIGKRRPSGTRTQGTLSAKPNGWGKAQVVN